MGKSVFCQIVYLWSRGTIRSSMLAGVPHRRIVVPPSQDTPHPRRTQGCLGSWGRGQASLMGMAGPQYVPVLHHVRAALHRGTQAPTGSEASLLLNAGSTNQGAPPMAGALSGPRFEERAGSVQASTSCFSCPDEKRAYSLNEYRYTLSPAVGCAVLWSALRCPRAGGPWGRREIALGARAAVQCS